MNFSSMKIVFSEFCGFFIRFKVNYKYTIKIIHIENGQLWGTNMGKPFYKITLQNEEQRTTKWFLSLFYLILLSYDLFYYYMIPRFVTHTAIGFPSLKNYFVYLFLFGLLPIAFYLHKRYKHAKIKYLYFCTYLSITFIVDIWDFYGTSANYSSGNVVEIFLILSTPLFLDLGYFWLVNLGIGLKYFLIGIILQSSLPVIPLVLVFLLALLSYVLLNRFRRYVYSIKSSYDEQIEGIVKGVIATLELKDPYTRGHSERVAQYAVVLAESTSKLTKEELKLFNYSCLLHDIGKVHIPDRILTKPEKLTPDEYEIIKLHPVVGENAVKEVDVLKDGLCVIRSHHERWDGAGYPDQLEGEDIPILARITAIADAFDAMTSSRSYREALPLEEAFQRIIQGKGSQFDPNLVELFKVIFPKWVNIHKNYPW